MEFSQIVSEYLAYLVITGHTAVNAKTALTLFTAFLEEVQLSYIYVRVTHAEHFQERLLASGSYAKATVLNIVGCLFSFYDYLLKRHLVTSNPFAVAYRPKRPKALPRNILTKEQTQTLLTALTAFNADDTVNGRRMFRNKHLISELMYASGLRRGEVCRLKLEDVDTERATLRVKDTKSNKERTAFLNDYCRQILSLYLSKVRPYIVTERQNKEFLFGSLTNVGSWFNEFLLQTTKSLELPGVTAHSFRHSFGVHLLANGCDIRFIKEMLGHSSLHTTQIYTRVDKHDLSRIIDECHPRTTVQTP